MNRHRPVKGHRPVADLLIALLYIGGNSFAVGADHRPRATDTVRVVSRSWLVVGTSN